MSVCEKCWRDANTNVLHMGGSVTEEYSKLCDTRASNQCTPLEQAGKVECPHCRCVYLYGEFHMCPDDQENQDGEL